MFVAEKWCAPLTGKNTDTGTGGVMKRKDRTRNTRERERERGGGGGVGRKSLILSVKSSILRDMKNMPNSTLRINAVLFGAKFVVSFSELMQHYPNNIVVSP